MRLIPAIDIIEGKCVRLTQGDYASKKIYAEDPLEIAKQFEDHGIRYLHLVDLDGAKSKQVVNYKVLRKITSQTSLKVDFGGGIKQEKDIQIAFDNGATQITVGSTAAKNPLLFIEWLRIYGRDKIILGADCQDHKIAIHGWKEKLEIDVIEYIHKNVNEGIEYVICTDISKDGMLQGPSMDLYKKILEITNCKLIASGGISTLSELQSLADLGCEGAIIGKAIYEKKITLKQLEKLC